MLTDEDLEFMRGAIAELMPDVFTVIRPKVSACYGSFVPSGCTAASYHGRLDWRSGREANDPLRVSSYVGYQLILPHNAGVSASDFVLDAAGRKYRVTSVDIGKSWACEMICAVEIVR